MDEMRGEPHKGPLGVTFAAAAAAVTPKLLFG